jgi:hypothetical protein
MESTAAGCADAFYLLSDTPHVETVVVFGKEPP